MADEETRLIFNDDTKIDGKEEQSQLENENNENDIDLHEEAESKLPEINYEALNGLRGFGALFVYLTHFFEYMYPQLIVGSDIDIQ